MNAATRTRIRAATDAHARDVCPSCGHFVHRLIHATGFCRRCTNDHQRGEPVTPHDNRTYP